MFGNALYIKEPIVDLFQHSFPLRICEYSQSDMVNAFCAVLYLSLVYASSRTHFNFIAFMKQSRPGINVVQGVPKCIVAASYNLF